MTTPTMRPFIAFLLALPPFGQLQRLASRGLTAPCLDDHAGPSIAQAASPARPSRLRARELTIDRDNAISRIEPTDRILGPIVYEFRIAHRGPKQ